MRRGTAKEFAKGTRRRWGGRYPVRGFLFSRLGKPWSEVHSEMSQEFKRGTRIGDLWWQQWHLDIAEGCWKGAETGKIYDSVGLEVSGFYVHPFTKLLCYQEPQKSHRRAPRTVDQYILDDKHSLNRYDGIWYMCDYRKPALGDYFYPGENRSIYVFHKKQLSKKELRHYGLVNEVVPRCLQCGHSESDFYHTDPNLSTPNQPPQHEYKYGAMFHPFEAPNTGG